MKSKKKSKTSLTAPSVNEVRSAVKKAVSDYIDLNEKIASRVSKAAAPILSSAKKTPLKPVAEFYQDISKKAFDYYVKGARSLVEAI
jgi:hypothetical protein